MIITLDFETYFDQDYRLKKLSTEEYVRDPQFKAHMVGLKFDQRPAIDCLPAMLETNEGLREQIRNSAVLCHHAHFDGLILSHVYDLRPKFWLDTLSMARLALPRLRSHSLDALATYFGLPNKTVPYNLFKGVRDLPHDLYCQVAAGCRHDADLTRQIFDLLLPYVPRDELKVIDATVRMFVEPCLRLDRPRLAAFLAQEVERKEALMFQVGATLQVDDRLDDDAYLAAVETELQSSDKFRTALEAIGHPCPMKWSEKAAAACHGCAGAGRETVLAPDNSTVVAPCSFCGGSGKNQTSKGGYIPALAKTDDGMKELLEHDDPRVSALAAARLGVKSTIDETRASRLLAAGNRGSLPVYLAFAAAKTIRFGGGDKTNWQNFRRGGEIRGSVVAPEGHKLVIVDAAQVECRGVNWQAGQTDVLDLFRAGRDVYCEAASRFYGREITKDDKRERFIFKTQELGCGYGLGWRKYQRQMRAGMLGGPPVILMDEEAQTGVNYYRAGHPRVIDYWKQATSVLGTLARGEEAQWGILTIADHMIYLPNGSPLDYEGLYWGYYEPGQPAPDEKPQWWHPGRKGRSKYYGGKLVENVTQALWSGLFIREAMVKIGARYRIVLQVHDELVAVVPDAETDAALPWMLDVLRTPPSWAPDIPLEAEGVVSERYAK